MSRQIELEDFSDQLERMKDHLTIDPRSTAIVTIDMHRGHLDPELASMPASRAVQARLVESGERILRVARSQDIPVVHVVLVWRPEEYGSYIVRSGAMDSGINILLSKDVEPTPAYAAGVRHNITGSRQTEVMPQLLEDSDAVIDNKKTFSIYRGTDLEMWLHQIAKADTAILLGINTNTCVQNAAFETVNAGIKPIVIAEGVGSMYGEDLHEFGLQNIARCIGWVLTEQEFYAKLGLSDAQVAAALGKRPARAARAGNGGTQPEAR